VALPPGTDVVLAVGLVAGDALAVVSGWAGRVGRPALHLLVHPPLLAPRRHPAVFLDELARRGREVRARALDEVMRLCLSLVPAVAEAVLDELAVTQLIQQHVDLDALVDGVDVDAVLNRLDVDAVLDRLDLTQVVRRRVDVDAVVADVDLDAVISRIDLVGLAEMVIDAIDLSGLIQQSTASVGTETVRGLRVSAIDADQAVSRLADRLLRRRRDVFGDRSPETAGDRSPPP
jgi:hypothetical protein